MRPTAAAAAVLDGRLAKSKWMAGDTVTIADIAAAAPMHMHERQRLPLDDFPEHPALDCGGRKTAVLAEDTRPGRSGVAAALIGIAPATEHRVGRHDRGDWDQKNRPGDVKSTFRYTRDTGVAPEVYFYEPPAGTKWRESGDDPAK